MLPTQSHSVDLLCAGGTQGRDGACPHHVAYSCMKTPNQLTQNRLPTHNLHPVTLHPPLCYAGRSQSLGHPDRSEHTGRGGGVDRDRAKIREEPQ